MSIVQVLVSQTAAPTPSDLQKKGAMISQGGTTLTAGTFVLARQASDITAILKPTAPLSALTWAGSIATATTVDPHGVPNGQQVKLTISGVTPAGYNGTFVGTSTGANSFTYPLTANPGAVTVQGSYRPGDVSELMQMATTFYAQGPQQAVYVLETGFVGDVPAIAALAAWLTANPLTFYAFLTPRSWLNEASYLTLKNSYNALTSMTYFFDTATLANYGSLTPAMKDTVALVEAPNLPAGEFSAAAPFFVAINYKPSATNKVTPFAYSYLYGVTPYPLAGNNAVLTALDNANVNIVGTGAEGGISNTILESGTTKDGRDYTYWYAVDWVQINLDRDVAACVINGSNNSLNPLYYNQQGIDRLQAVAAGTMGRGATYGLVNGAPVQVQMDPADFLVALDNGDFNGQTVINAQPFIPYSAANPNDYAVGLYTGLQIAFLPNRGFKHIVISVNVTDFVTAA